jgi:thioredoxin 1
MRFATFLISTLLISAACVAPSLAFETKPFEMKAFDDARAQGKSVLVDVFAPWCPYCKAQHEVFNKLKSMLKATKQSTLIAFKGEKETGRSVGVTDAGQIEDLLRSTRN